MAEHSFSQVFSVVRAVDAYELHYAVSRTFGQRIFIFAVLALVLFAMGWALFPRDDDFSTTALAGLAAVSLVIAYLIAWPFKRWNRLGLKPQIKSFRERMALGETVTTYSFDSEELKIDDELHGGRVPWSKVHAWHDAPDLLLIYRGPQFFYFLDKTRMDEPTRNALIERLVSSPAKRL